MHSTILAVMIQRPGYADSSALRTLHKTVAVLFVTLLTIVAAQVSLMS